MKNVAILFLFIFIPLERAYSCGMTLHMFMAEEAFKSIGNNQLRDFLEKEKKAYLNGAYYPDSGYLVLRVWPKPGLHSEGKYGEFSHWEGFQNIYLRYIRDRCAFPFENCRPLLAYLFGCLAHSIGDLNFDHHFYPQVANHDFGGDWAKTGDFTDIGLDYLVIMEHSRGLAVPWHYVPLEELLEIYRRANMQISKQDIVKGTNLSRTALLGERVAAPFKYHHYKNLAPWGAQNYMTAKGGVLDTASLIAKFLDDLWASLETHKDSKKLPNITRDRDGFKVGP